MDGQWVRQKKVFSFALTIYVIYILCEQWTTKLDTVDLFSIRVLGEVMYIYYIPIAYTYSS